MCIYITFASRLNVTLQCADSNEAAVVFLSSLKADF